MKAEALARERHVLAEDTFVEIVVWRVPRPIKGSGHGLMKEATMNRVTLEVASRDEVTRRGLAALRGKKQRARISFATPELLWKVLTAKRWELLKAMAGQGPLTIREVARRVNRDVKAVHGDVRALLDAGLVDKTAKNQVVFPFNAIRVDFTLRAASARAL
jgi:predicted transcriptional regulator